MQGAEFCEIEQSLNSIEEKLQREVNLDPRTKRYLEDLRKLHLRTLFYLEEQALEPSGSA